MHQFNFDYDAQSKHLTVTVIDTSTNEPIEIVEYWHMSGDRYEHKCIKSSDAMTWREHEEPLARLDSLSAAARLAFVQTLTEDEQYIYAHLTEVEEDDVLWLFNDEDKAYSIKSNLFTTLDPYIDFHSASLTPAIYH
ncbi:hypothetical protein ACRTDO_09800 [Vibrio furnissii]|uniref:hypothetical protein n=1 Tax=Vibrio furnissii TaxID=29494 RepID=UPI003D7DBD4D